MFFKPKPNLPDAAKARIEFHLQRIAECIGVDRFQRPVLSRKMLRGLVESKQTPRQMIAFVGNHLAHDVGEIRFDLAPQQLQNCGGGG